MYKFELHINSHKTNVIEHIIESDNISEYISITDTIVTISINNAIHIIPIDIYNNSYISIYPYSKPKTLSF